MANKYWIFLFLVFSFIGCSKSETINKNEWIKQNGEYEEGIFTLEIYDNMDFSITIYSVYYGEIVGKVEGKLKSIKPVSKPGLNVYYAVFEDYIGEFDGRKGNGIIVLVEKDNNITLNIFGDNINSIAGYYPYSGLYIKNEPLNKEDEEKLELFFKDIYDIPKVKSLLGLDVKYFLEIFDSFTVDKTDEKIIIDGWIPGGNRFTNGIIKIENNYIYILFGDTRNGEQYIYYSNDNNLKELPKEFFEWSHFPNKENIRIK
jgi:hypothetical protein